MDADDWESDMDVEKSIDKDYYCMFNMDVNLNVHVVDNYKSDMDIDTEVDNAYADVNVEAYADAPQCINYGLGEYSYKRTGDECCNTGYREPVLGISYVFTKYQTFSGKIHPIGWI